MWVCVCDKETVRLEVTGVGRTGSEDRTLSMSEVPEVIPSE